MHDRLFVRLVPVTLPLPQTPVCRVCVQRGHRPRPVHRLGGVGAVALAVHVEVHV